MKHLFSNYTLKLPIYYVYMLQQVEYDPAKFSEWRLRLAKQNRPVQSVMHRQKLVWTFRAKALVAVSYVMAFSFMVNKYIVVQKSILYQAVIFVGSLIVLPEMLFFFLLALTYVAHRVIVRPKNRRLIAASRQIFKATTATKIAVIGSYGKTTMKELLATVLSEGKHVAVTPGNKNVQVSHAVFARKLTGNEDVIVVEFGEGEPGDVEKMSQTVKPDYAIITGLAPNHLDHYPSMNSLAKDLFSAGSVVEPVKLLVNADSKSLMEYAGNEKTYSSSGVLGWKVEKIQIDIHGTNFVLSRGSEEMKLKSALLGRHQVGPLACVAALAFELGMSVSQIEAGVSKTVPYEHRMQPRLLSGAWVIDDTYNGNIDGLIAGLDLLRELEAKRKWYVTPGLVDQGVETESVHQVLGKKIAEVNPDIVVLMENSVSAIVQSAMKEHGFSGDLRIIDDPLAFYQGIEHQLALGDLVLMQNDWTDNYN